MTQLYEYHIDMSCHTDTNYQEGDAEYDYSWSSDTSIIIHGVNLLDSKKTNSTVISTQVFEEGDRAYMVFVAWGSGDSFGHSTNTDHTAVHLFKDKTLAELLIAQIKYDYITNGDNYHYQSSFIEYLADDNSMHKLPTYAWKGYFESIDTLLLSEVIIDKKLCENTIHTIPHESEKKEFQEEFLILSEKVKIERFLNRVENNSKKIIHKV